MVSYQSIGRVCANRWLWLWHCWRLRNQVRELAKAVAEFPKERDAAHLVLLELEALKANLKSQSEDYQIAKDGNRALLRFIHTRHRLNMKFDPGSIRAALQTADQKK